MSRIADAWQNVQKQERRALITYITAGDPTIVDTERLVLAMERAGADIVELGIPYSDPLADGPVIQRAAKRALDGGLKVRHCLAAVAHLRQQTEIPLVFLVYYATVFKYGVEDFLTDCSQAGLDGLIIPDLPLEERSQLRALVADKGLDLDLIPLVAPTSGKRIPDLVEGASGFVYCVSSLGVTGVRESLGSQAQDVTSAVRRYTTVPAALGFGIARPEQIQELWDAADGFIVGSAIVRELEAGLAAKDSEQRVYALVRQLRDGVEVGPAQVR